MARIERRDEHCASVMDGSPNGQARPLWEPAEVARAAEREAERAERAKLIEALRVVAGARDGEKAEWQATVDKLRSELAEARDALADARRAAADATDAAAKAREARENDRVLYQTDRTSWAHDRRQLEIKNGALKQEAARGWVARLVRGKGAF